MLYKISTTNLTDHSIRRGNYPYAALSGIPTIVSEQISNDNPMALRQRIQIIRNLEESRANDGHFDGGDEEGEP